MWCWKHKAASDFVSPLLMLLCGIYTSLSACVTQDLRCRLFCRLLYRKCIQVMPLDSPLGCAVTMTCWYESNTLSSWVQSVSFSRRRVMLPLLKSDLSLLSLLFRLSFAPWAGQSESVPSWFLLARGLKNLLYFWMKLGGLLHRSRAKSQYQSRFSFLVRYPFFFIYSIGFGLCMNVDTR